MHGRGHLGLAADSSAFRSLRRQISNRQGAAIRPYRVFGPRRSDSTTNNLMHLPEQLDFLLRSRLNFCVHQIKYAEKSGRILHRRTAQSHHHRSVRPQAKFAPSS